jgi:MoaA/NifB/PqqE/SkfB family radical SAM enzyme
MGPFEILQVVGARTMGRAVPLAVGFEVTHLCNLTCSYCDRHTRLPNEMSREEIFRALEELHGLGMKHMSLDGGEPLSHPDIDEIARWLNDHEVSAFMNTNAILVPKKLATVKRMRKIKVSVDGPQAAHDLMRGKKAWERAMRGIDAARGAGVPVELTCVVGAHSAPFVDELLDTVAALGLSIVFQPERSSLFGGRGDPIVAAQIRDAFARIEARKREQGPVGNRWSSLRHFRNFPEEQEIGCAAGMINATLDPRGNLYACGQTVRPDDAPNVVKLGAAEAFQSIPREGCTQCWCARVVEENIAYSGRFDRMLAPKPLNPVPARGVAATVRRLPIVS